MARKNNSVCESFAQQELPLMTFWQCKSLNNRVDAFNEGAE